MSGEPWRVEDRLTPERVAAWLAEVFDPAVREVTIGRLAGGHSNGAWRLDVAIPDGVVPLVLKAPDDTTLVFRRDAGGAAARLRAAAAPFQYSSRS